MKARPFLLPSLCALSLGCMSLHAQQPIVLQQHMAGADFKQAGLDKLSPAELLHLERWLSAHATELAAAVPASDATSATVAAGKKPARSGSWFGRESGPGSEKARTTVISRIAGDFTGWQPNHTLSLQNGQKWRVSDDSQLIVSKPLASPEVTIKPGSIGGWILKVQGYNSSARVEPAN